MELSVLVPSTYEERLRVRVIRCGPDALCAALELFERRDPPTLDEALTLVRGPRELSPQAFAVVVEAWDRYFHMRSMPWS